MLRMQISTDSATTLWFDLEKQLGNKHGQSSSECIGGFAMAFIGKAGRVADAVKRSPKVLRKKIERKFGSHESK